MIYIGADHAGFAAKEYIKKVLDKKNIAYVDFGAKKHSPHDDYPDYAAKVARRVAKERGMGVLVCSTGIGMSIAANKVRGARAALVHDKKGAMMAREHNNANIIALAGKRFPKKKAALLVLTFINTRFTGAARHVRRLRKVSRIQ